MTFEKSTSLSILVKSNTKYITGRNLLSEIRQRDMFRKEVNGLIIISDRNVFGLYRTLIRKSLGNIAPKVIEVIVDPGENSKSLAQVQNILGILHENKAGRNWGLAAIGGGMVTDLAGFVGSILFRGIPLCLFPTTLLGQIDAAIGGKTGVNFTQKGIMYKNTIGTFFFPDTVISDTLFLDTLKDREIRSGLGEAVKYWVLWGKPDNSMLNRFALGKSSAKDTAKLINICQVRKLETVTADPLDSKGVREKLNLGHTIGHAVEGASEGELSHGESVAIGLVASARISCLMGLLKEDRRDLIIESVQKLGLPVKVPGIDMRKIHKTLELDKKTGTFVLIRDIGNVIVGHKVPHEILEKVLGEIV